VEPVAHSRGEVGRIEATGCQVGAGHLHGELSVIRDRAGGAGLPPTPRVEVAELAIPLGDRGRASALTRPAKRIPYRPSDEAASVSIPQDMEVRRKRG
jgi:hypothetical protein